MYLLNDFLDNTLVIAAVSVVLPWSTWPIVPTLQCGFSLFSGVFGLGGFVLIEKLEQQMMKQFFGFYIQKEQKYVQLNFFVKIDMHSPLN